METFISSPENPLIKSITRLHTTKGRRAAGLFIAEGKRVCELFLQAQYPLRYLLVLEEHEPWALELQVDPNLIVVVSGRVMGKISCAVTPSGILAVLELPSDESMVPSELKSGLVLAHVQDPGNAGTLIRTATAFNFETYLIEGVDCFGPKVVQSTAGALAHRRVWRLSWEQLFERTTAQKALLTALVPRSGTPIAQMQSHPCRLLVVGGEAEGIPEAWLKSCQEHCTIPMVLEVESLNAAVAGAIGLYELSKSSK